MSHDLIKLYKDITGKETGLEVKDKIENNLHEKMREHFLELLHIGSVIGYDQLYEEMTQAMNLIEKLKKQ